MGSNNATLQQVIPTSYWMGSTKNIDSSQSNFVSSKIPSHPQLFFKKCIYMQSHLSIYLSTLLIFLTKIFIFIIKIRINTTKFTTLKTKKKRTNIPRLPINILCRIRLLIDLTSHLIKQSIIESFHQMRMLHIT